MPKMLHKVLELGMLASIVLTLATPFNDAYAQGLECDLDGDGYISMPADGTDVILGESFDVNGNYSAAEWSSFFETFSKDSASASLCNALTFKNGAEPIRCDQTMVQPNSDVYDSSRVSSVQGSKVYPGAFDQPDNGIDEDCDGADGKLIDGGDTTKVENLGNRAIVMLSRAVVFISIVILILGGAMYATAAGDEKKTTKARKAIIGAIIGLAVGLLAPSVVNFIIASLG